MNDMNFWGDGAGFDTEIAPGQLSRRSRGARKHATALGVLALGRHVCFKKDAAPAPPPDPAIGQAAMANAEIAKDWLAFSKDQFADSKGRQDDYDSLIKQVVDSQIGAQNQSSQWATEDRATQKANAAKYDQWADEDRAAGKAAQGKFDAYAKDATDLAGRYQGWMTDVANDFGGRADGQFDFAKTQQGRYASTFQPIEDRFASDAMNWDSPERLASEAAKARADVATSAAAQQQAQQRQMASMGVDPRSGRFAGIDRATGLATALAEAGAENTARDTVRQQGIQLRGQAINVGQGVLNNANTATGLGMQARSAQLGATQAGYATGSSGNAQAMQATTGGLAAVGVGNNSAQLGLGQTSSPYAGLSTGITAGNSAVSNGGAGQNSFYGSTGIMNSGFAGAISGNNSAGNLLNTQYGNQLNAWGMQQQANASSSAGMGSMLGQIAGAGVSLYL